MGRKLFINLLGLLLVISTSVSQNTFLYFYYPESISKWFCSQTHFYTIHLQSELIVKNKKGGICMYIVTVFIYKKCTALVKSQQKTSDTLITSFIKFCGLSTALCQLMLTQQPRSLARSDCLPSSYLREHFDELQIYPVLFKSLKSENVRTPGSVPWPPNHIFPLFCISFLRIQQNKRPLINNY